MGSLAADPGAAIPTANPHTGVGQAEHRLTDTDNHRSRELGDDDALSSCAHSPTDRSAAAISRASGAIDIVASWR